MNNNLVKIQNDMFGINSRVRSLNRDYQIYYNRGTAKYELHCQNLYPSLQLVLPYDRLDTRVVEYIAKTRVQNIEDIVKEITAHNDSVEKQYNDQIINDNLSKLRLIGN